MMKPLQKIKLKNLLTLGKVKKYIIVKLQSYGISGEIIENSLEKYFSKFANNDFLAALNFARKKDRAILSKTI